MSWCSDAPEDEAISLFAGLLDNPDVRLSQECYSLADTVVQLICISPCHFSWITRSQVCLALAKASLRIAHVVSSCLVHLAMWA